ncbi:MAG: hypothetical protein ABEK12_00390, partial [Candidatus Nanohaloarchaea archaeon]
MPRGCDRCDATFDTERALLEHELDAHAEDLTSHEADETKRRLNRLDGSGEDGLPVPRTALYAVGALAVLAAAGYGLAATGT